MTSAPRTRAGPLTAAEGGFVQSGRGATGSCAGRRSLRGQPSRGSTAALIPLHVREQRHLAGTLDRPGDLALLLRVQPRRAARQDLAALGEEALKLTNVLVIDELARIEGRGLTAWHRISAVV